MSADADRASDDLPAPHAASTTEIDVHGPGRLEHWARELGVPPQTLLAAVQAVGPRVDRVKDHLTAGGAAGQADG
ncbi:DUF3606 domain-containing protein [Aquabacterium sp. J223]|uniref:DUF3606 domain-containing protein n=1 Tax=Aquabacterium sp. J223 TaxID=2898431 RepID=UPI0021ADD6D1|nr:DUF3606 domain-containing protein [Aquabacterium sp. J223]UUX96056.1 DUF3606 domain-containing protein [Aquabacterium sp. J223]